MIFVANNSKINNMSTKEIISESNKIRRNIEESRIREVFLMMRNLALQLKNWQINDELDRIENTYKFMIHYMIEGVEDPEREKQFQTLTENLYRLNDRIEMELLKKSDFGVYFSSLRTFEVRKNTFAELLSKYDNCHSKCDLLVESNSYDITLFKEREDSLKDIFNYIWLTQHLSSSDYDLVNSVILEEEKDDILKCQIVSALFLGLLQYYDYRKFSLILSMCINPIDYRVVARAMVCLLLILSIHKDRIKRDETILAKLQSLSDSAELMKELKNVVFDLIRTRDTDRISKKMKEEILPELMNLQPKIINRFKGLNSEADLMSIEENPEWEELLNKSNLKNKIEELTEMQKDGGDVMMVAFSNLKNFAFFNSVSNWFLPFTSNHSELNFADNRRFSDKLSFMIENSMMCDSDRFSFMLAVSKMPQAQREMIIGQIDSHLSQMDEEHRASIQSIKTSNISTEVSKYVKDIYRFFKLYINKKGFYDPFKLPINFIHIPCLSNYLSSEENLSVLGEFYFNKGYYRDACELFTRMSEQYGANDVLYQKIGYCYQSEKEYDRALEYYLKSELLSSDSKWLIKKIAYCYKSIRNYNKSVEYYRKAIENEPENLSLELNLGHCLLECGQIEAALKSYYKVEYLDEQGRKALRPIAWCEFISGNYEKSEKYYNKILKESESSQDYINAAHLYFAKRDTRKALGLYKESLNYGNNDLNELIDSINSDRKYLIEQGLDGQEISIMIDKILYDMKLS